MPTTDSIDEPIARRIQGTGRAFHCMSVVFVIPHLCDNLSATFCLENTAVNQTEGINETLLERLVLQHLQEDVDEEILARTISRIAETAFQTS